MATKETRINNLTRARCRAHVGAVTSHDCRLDVEQEPVEPSQPAFTTPLVSACQSKHSFVSVRACVRVSWYPAVYTLPTCVHTGTVLFTLLFRN